MLEHGGQLLQAAARYKIPLADWLDLSTGINPNPWSVPPFPVASWARLPEDDDGLVAAAQRYYGARDVLPLAGSQAAIMTLPLLRPRCKVGVLHPGYGEHAQSWRRAGHDVLPLVATDIDEAVLGLDVLVLINPNNPTGEDFPVGQMLQWHRALAARGGWLVVDEAFMDCMPEQSLCGYTEREGLIVLRSFGKFFGLAGARVGFAVAHRDLLSALQSALGPWTVNGPARELATVALMDHDWQVAARERLKADGARLGALLTRHGLAPDGGCALFQWKRLRRAADLHDALARKGILTRLFAEPSALRFGLPGREADWRRLDGALSELR